MKCTLLYTISQFRNGRPAAYGESMAEPLQPERLAPRATSNWNGGRDHLGILGEIKSVHPGEIIGIRNHSRDNSPKRISKNTQRIDIRPKSKAGESFSPGLSSSS
jgi:hypothetical protein